MSVVHVGANAWSSPYLGGRELFSRSYCDTTLVTDLSVVIADSTMLLTKAVSSEYRQFCVCLHVQRLIFFRPAESGTSSYGVSVSTDCPAYAEIFLFVLQAYGGAISATVGSYALSFISFGSSNATSLDTRCINCHMRVTNVFISKSSALSNVGGQDFASSQGVFVRAMML